jgi:hypothetical protein
MSKILTPAILAVLVAFVTNAVADSRVPAKLLGSADQTPVTIVSLKSSDCCTTAPAECKTYKPCVSYCGGFCSCGPKVSQTLMVKDPCDCCCELAEIPVCLPACCTGKPCVSSRCGWFGRGIIVYEYDCGACVTIVFRRCGDVVVKYSG